MNDVGAGKAGMCLPYDAETSVHLKSEDVAELKTGR